MHLLASLILATSPLAPPPLTAEQAVVEAWANHPQTLRNEAAAARAGSELAATSVWLPNPELTAAGLTDAVAKREGESDLSIALSQTVPSPVTRWFASSAAGRRVEAVALSRLRAEQQLAAAVVAAMAELAAARELVGVEGEVSAVAARMVAATKTRAEHGLLAPVEGALARLDEDSASAALADAERREAVAAARLCELLGRASCALGEVAWPTLAEPPPTGDETFERRPDVVSAARALDAAKDDETAAAFQRIPPVTLEVGYQRAATVLPVAGGDATDVDHLFGVSVSVPLPAFDWGTAAVMHAQAERLNAEADARERALGARAEAAEAQAAHRAARASWQRLSAGVAQVGAALDEAARGYESGALALEQFLAIRDRIARARRAALEARRADVEAHARLLLALGNPVVEVKR